MLIMLYPKEISDLVSLIMIQQYLSAAGDMQMFAPGKRRTYLACVAGSQDMYTTLTGLYAFS